MMRFVWPLLALTSAALALWIDSHAVISSWYCRAGLCRAGDLRPGKRETLERYEAVYRVMVAQEAANPYRWGELAELEALQRKRSEARLAWQRVAALGLGTAPVLMRAVNAYAEDGDTESVIATAYKVLTMTDDYDVPIFDYLHRFFKLPTTQILRRALPPRCGALQHWIDWISANGHTGEISQSWHRALKQGCADDNLAGRYAWTLFGRQAYDQASRDWAEYMAVAHRESLAPAELLWNEDFHRAPFAAPFDWTLENSSDVELVRQNGLRVTFLGKENIDFHHIRQFVSVDPGAYVLAVDAEAAGLTTNEGPRISIHGAQSDRWSVLGPMYRGDVPRQTRTTILRVPARTPYIAIEIVRLPSWKIESKIEGTLTLHSVRLRRRE